MNDLTAQNIREAGYNHGLAAASWYFDGNTSRETYAAVLNGLEDGDPAILDTLPSAPLSGEWADGPTPQTLADDFDIGPDDLDDACKIYEDAFHTAAHHEIERVARYQLAPEDDERNAWERDAIQREKKGAARTPDPTL